MSGAGFDWAEALLDRTALWTQASQHGEVTMEADDSPKITGELQRKLSTYMFDQQLRMMVNRTRWAANEGFDFRIAAYDLPRSLFDSVRDCQDPEERLTVANPDDPMWMKVVTDKVTIYTKEPPTRKRSEGHSETADEGDQDHAHDKEGKGDSGGDEGEDYHIYLLRGSSMELPLHKQYKFDLDRSCPSCPSKMRIYGDLQDIPETSDIKMTWECDKCETRVIQWLALEHTSWEPGPRGRVLKAPL